MAFDDYTKNKMKEGKKEEINDIFKKIELLLFSSSDDIRGTFEVCFFEGLLNLFLRNPTLSSKFNLSQILGPIYKKLCERNDEGWGTQTPIL